MAKDINLYKSLGVKNTSNIDEVSRGYAEKSEIPKSQIDARHKEAL